MKSLDRIESMTGLKMMKIAFNGALVEHKGRLIRDIRISKKAFEKAVGFLKGKTEAIIAFTPSSYAIMADSFWVNEQYRILGEYGIEMDLSDHEKVCEVAGDAPCKLLAKDNDHSKIARLKTELGNLLEGEAEVFSSFPNNIEIIPAGIDKGSALEAVSELLSIPLSPWASIRSRADRKRCRNSMMEHAPLPVLPSQRMRRSLTRRSSTAATSAMPTTCLTISSMCCKRWEKAQAMFPIMSSPSMRSGSRWRNEDSVFLQ